MVASYQTSKQPPFTSPLPPGWSPLAAVDIRSLDPLAGTIQESTLAPAATVKLPLPATVTIDPATPPLFALYDPASHSWKAKGSVTVAADGLSATAAIAASGQYAIVIPDPAPNAPAAVTAGNSLSAAASQPLDFSLTTVTGKAALPAALASIGLKTAGEVVVTAKEGAAPVFTSGLILVSRITEKFDLKSGYKIESPVYSQDIVLYRQPCITSIGAGAVPPIAVSGAESPLVF